MIGRNSGEYDGKPYGGFYTQEQAREIALPEGVEMVMPGDNIAMTVELIHPILREKSVGV